MVWHLWHCDEDYGRRVADKAGIDLQKAKALPQLRGKPAPDERRAASTYSDGKLEGAPPRERKASESASQATNEQSVT